MQITLNVEGSQLDSEVKELLANLTQEQKQQMAMQLLTTALNNTTSSLNATVAEQLALDKLLEETGRKYVKKLDHWNQLEWYYQTKNEDGSWSHLMSTEYGDREKINKAITKAQSISSFFKSEVVDQLAATAKSQVKEMVESSEEINKAIEVAKEKITESLPQLVQQAMICYFSSHMTNMMQAVTSQFFQGQATQQLTTQIQNALVEKGICV